MGAESAVAAAAAEAPVSEAFEVTAASWASCWEIEEEEAIRKDRLVVISRGEGVDPPTRR